MILDQLAASARRRVEKDKKIMALQEMERRAYALTEPETGKNRRFEAALRSSGVHLICEVKRASPSKGLIAEQFPYLEIAKEYEQAGADAISVLTEPEYFLGSDRYLKEIRSVVTLPILRKDFTVDEYQIFQAKELGADCILLICALLTGESLQQFLRLCLELHLSALVEAHDEREVDMALQAGAGLIGVNNRDLKTFEVDRNNSIRLRERVPKEVLFVAESGIRSEADVKELFEAGVNGILVGETLMRSGDKRAMLQKLKGERNGGDDLTDRA